MKEIQRWGSSYYKCVLWMVSMVLYGDNVHLKCLFSDVVMYLEVHTHTLMEIFPDPASVQMFQVNPPLWLILCVL